MKMIDKKKAQQIKGALDLIAAINKAREPVEKPKKKPKTKKKSKKV